MRTAIGILGVLGLGVTVAVAQSPSTPSGKQRAATLLPPTAATPEDLPPVARGVADDVPSYSNTTPITPVRPGQSLWGNGNDPNVRPAGGIDGNPSVGSVAPPAVSTNDDPSAISRSLDKLKGAFGSSPPPGAGDGRAQPNANTPFRGTTANGSTIYAGPPTWRWYGWGMVTPGANPNAPTGQYPKASANWYSITGATPGAFPVPVTNPGRSPAGTEPPAYVATPSPRSTPTTYSPPTIVAPVVQPVPPVPTVTDLQRTNPPPENRGSVAAPIASPSLTPNPITPIPPLSFPVPPPASPTPSAKTEVIVPAPALPQIPSLTQTPALPVPALTMPPGPIMPPAPTNSPPMGLQGFLPPTTALHPSAPHQAEPQAIEAQPIIPLTPTPISGPTNTTSESKSGNSDLTPGSGATPTPGALPVSVTEYQLRWQPTTQTSTQGEWTTPGKPRPISTPATQPLAPAPAVAPAAAPAPAPADWQQPGAVDTTHSPTIARGQIGDTGPDPVVALLRRICDGRAEGVDIRRTGSTRISVCFECRSTGDAQQLVRDISAKPELTPYRIDFCVLVK
jgi:hypothetical protein